MIYKIYPKIAGTPIDSAVGIPGDGSLFEFSLVEPSPELDAYNVWLLDGGTPEIDTGLSEYSRVPQAVTAWQAKTALIQAGLFAQVEAAINAMPGSAGEQARTDWVSAVTWRRDWTTITLMQQSFGWSADYIDQLFITASKL